MRTCATARRGCTAPRSRPTTRETAQTMSRPGRGSCCCTAGHGVQGMLVAADHDRFFVPPYVGHRGWLGLRLDRGLDWNELEGIVEDAYAEVAPARLVAAAAERSA